MCNTLYHSINFSFNFVSSFHHFPVRQNSALIVEFPPIENCLGHSYFHQCLTCFQTCLPFSISFFIRGTHFQRLWLRMLPGNSQTKTKSTWSLLTRVWW